MADERTAVSVSGKRMSIDDDGGRFDPIAERKMPGEAALQDGKAAIQSRASKRFANLKLNSDASLRSQKVVDVIVQTQWDWIRSANSIKNFFRGYRTRFQIFICVLHSAMAVIASVKLGVHGPVTHLDAVKEAIASAGAGRLGSSDSCLWSTVETGHFPIQSSIVREL
jgi:hypothetical protein